MPTIVAGTNSYITVEEADAQLDEMYLTEDWFQLNPDDKARLLIVATRQIDRLRCKYNKADAAQNLQYPVRLVDGTIVGENEAKAATLEQAWYLFRNFENLQSAQDQAISNIRSENLGAIQTAKSVAGFNPYKLYSPDVYSIMAGLIDLSTKVARG